MRIVGGTMLLGPLALGASAVHAYNGEWGKAGISLGLRAATVLATVATDQANENAAAVPFLFGLAFTLGYDIVSAERGEAVRKPPPVAPAVGMTHDGRPTAGVRLTF